MERIQLTVRFIISKWKSTSGRRDWHSVLPNLVHSYNVSEHSVTKVEPAIALTIKNRSQGTELAFPSYRLREFGNTTIFYRYELLGPIGDASGLFYVCLRYSVREVAAVIPGHAIAALGVVVIPA
jgi:hypothetical protein